MARLFWVALGAAAGVYAVRKVSKAAEAYTPTGVAHGLADFGDGLAVGATYDGTPAALVLRQPAGDVQVVDLYLCGTTEPTRSITTCGIRARGLRRRHMRTTSAQSSG